MMKYAFCLHLFESSSIIAVIWVNYFICRPSVCTYNHCNDLKSKMAAPMFAYSPIQAIGVNVDW